MNRMFLAAAALMLTTTAGAQGAGKLSDPTRPPSVEPSAELAAPEGPRLQSVLISPTRRSAIISGLSVEPGAKFGEATVESITANAVVLKYPDRRETLQLLPGAGKREHRRTGSAATASATDKGTGR